MNNVTNQGLEWQQTHHVGEILTLLADALRETNPVLREIITRRIYLLSDKAKETY